MLENKKHDDFVIFMHEIVFRIHAAVSFLFQHKH